MAMLNDNNNKGGGEERRGGAATISKPNCTEPHRWILHPSTFCCANPQNMQQSTLHRYAQTHAQKQSETFANSQRNSNQIPFMAMSPGVVMGPHQGCAASRP